MEEYQKNPLIDEARNDSSSEESEEKSVNDSSHKSVVAWIVIGFLLLGGCALGAVMLLGGVSRFGDQVVSSIDENHGIVSNTNGNNEGGGVIEAGGEKAEKVYYLGDEENGFVAVSDNIWTKIDQDEARGVRYYAGLYVLLLSTLESSSVSVAEYVQSVYNVMVPSLGADNVSMEEIDFGSYDEAYKLIMKNESTSSWSDEWVFNAEDEKIHYILIQGLDLNDDKFMIPETFRLKMPE